MTVLEVIQRSAEFLGRKGVESPRLQVELLLAHLLQLPRLQLYLNFERPLTESELDAVRELVRRRGQREPLQHLTGVAPFCDLELCVTAATLVPRPETEVLAEHAWTWLGRRGLATPRILDFGTGTGCLAICLARQCPNARITAIDVSPAALRIARQNAERHQVSDRIEFVEVDGLKAEFPAGAFDLLVANPPYLESGSIATLEPEVRDHDPRLALDGGPDGLDFMRRLAMAHDWLTEGGRILVEFGDGQGEAIRALFGGGAWVDADVLPDLSGRARIFVAARGRK